MQFLHVTGYRVSRNCIDKSQTRKHKISRNFAESSRFRVPFRGSDITKEVDRNNLHSNMLLQSLEPPPPHPSRNQS